MVTLRQTAALIRYLLYLAGTVHLLVICIKSDQTPEPQDEKALDPLRFDVFCLSLSELQYYFNRQECMVVSNTEIFQGPVLMMVLQHF